MTVSDEASRESFQASSTYFLLLTDQEWWHYDSFIDYGGMIMKFEPANLDEKELHELLGRAIAPLPISLVSTVSEKGTYNAAPYSMLFPVCWKPPIVCLSISLRQGGQKKDTQHNIEFSRDFVVNIMDESRINSTIQASINYPSDIDEIKEVGLTAIPADKVKSPLIAEAQVSFECQVRQQLELGSGPQLRCIIFGEVVLAHVKDKVWVNGRIEPAEMKTVGRLGTGVYCHTNDIFRLKFPDWASLSKTRGGGSTSR